MSADDLFTLIRNLDDLIHLPGGVDSFRKTIVDLAVTGHLVRASPQQESVDDLLIKIAAEKTALGLRGEVSTLESEDLPMIPDGWRFVHLGDILAHCRNGTSASPNDVGNGYPLLRISAGTSRQDGFVELSDYKFAALAEEQAAPYALRAGDLLACRFNGNLHYVGKVSEVPAHITGSILHPDKLICMRAINVSHAYLRYVMSSSFVRRQIESVAATTAGNIGINGKQIKNLVVPLAPLHEQQLIATRLGEVFRLLDKVATESAEEESARRAMSRCALRELSVGDSRAALEMMEDLIQKPEDINILEKTILALAVSGQLTNVRTDEMPSRLVSDIKQAALNSTMLVDRQGNSVEEPYKVPEAWHWVPLGAVLTRIEAGWSPSAQAGPKEGDAWGVLKVSACSWGEFRPAENKALGPGQTPRPHLEVKAGDFLISRANTSELVGRSVVVRETPAHLMLSDKTLRMSVVGDCNVDYLNLANLGPAARVHYEREATGTSSSMKNVSQEVIRRTPIPLPPREEQDRIVALVDKLRTLLRALRFRLAA